MTADQALYKVTPAAVNGMPARLAKVEEPADAMKEQRFCYQPEVHDGRLVFASIRGAMAYTCENGDLQLMWLAADRPNLARGATGYAFLSREEMVVSSPYGLLRFCPISYGGPASSKISLPQCRQVLLEPGKPGSVIARTFLQEVWRVILPPNNSPTAEGVKRLVLSRSQAGEIYQLFAQNGQLYAYTAKGTWKLSPGAESFTKTEPERPDAWLWSGGAEGALTGWKLRRLYQSERSPGESPLYALHRARSDPDTGWRSESEPCLFINELGTFRTAYPEADGALWLGGSHGILRVDTKLLPQQARRRPARPLWGLVRSQERLLPLFRANPLELPSGSALGFDWSAPQADRFFPVLYESRLEGVEETWSAPSRVSVRTLERMDPGSYTLWVRMACLAGPPGPAISYSFRILPPWYHSPFAYVLGLFLAGSVIYLLVLLRTNKLRRRQRELEAAVQRRTNELQATAVALQQSAHAKTEFISTVSHELRNPLIGARMMAEVLFKAPIDPVAHGQVSKLRTCLSYLQTLLDGTLDLSRFQLGQVPYKLTRFQLGRLVGDTASMFEALAAEKGISYRIELGPWKEAWFCGESKHLQRVLVNFLSNAFKFTRKGEILLSVTVGQTSKTAFETLRFTVRDTGPGVAAAVQGQLFRAIVRQSDPLNQSGTPGTGLGLALSRKIAELSGASLGFENRPGEGATFWVEWPLLAASPEETDTTPGGRDFSRLRVLVVEDDPLQQEATALLLEELGVVAETAKSVDEAEKLMREIRFDLVLADYNLGGATGIDLIARCRLLPGSKGSSTRFHMLTSHLSEPVRRSALRAGFIGFHSKPLSLPTLYAMLAPPPSSVPSSAIHES